ncbi:MAG: tRNA (N6-threonylcarbamoyladenosine(37)-N6)-methyltransferase TrmO [Thiohalophilus sp.]
MEYSFESIGIVHSCFTDKFGVPRQPHLVPAASGYIELLPPYAREEAVRGLDEFSHIWVLFVFHMAKREQWKPTVRPPRLGGNRRVGVFASRSPERANPIGLSLLKLDDITISAGKISLAVSELDLVDGTPVLDIKPYLPYADSVENVRAGYAPDAPSSRLPVQFESAVQQQLPQLTAIYPNLEDLIVQVLQQDPRPAYQDGQEDSERIFGIRLYDLEIKWLVRPGEVRVLKIEQAR